MNSPVVHRDANSERRESIKFAVVLIAFCLFLLVALWPEGKARRDPYQTVPETGYAK